MPDTITPAKVQHLSSDHAFREVETARGHHEVSDGAALTIASWWQSSGHTGHVLASLASGCTVDVTDLLDDIARTRADVTTYADNLALDMLATWAINHPTRTKEGE